MNIAVIPARAGSKGIPGKNYRVINGKPLVAWSIEAALACPRVDLIVVSSNCPEVEKVTRPYVAANRWVHFLPRPDEIADDYSLTEDAVVHALDYAINEVDVTPTWVTILQPTSPVRTDKLLNSCCDAVLGGNIWDSLITCSAHTPFFYTMGQYWDAVPAGHNPCDRPMRQELLPNQFLYHDCGNVYMTRAETFLEGYCRVGTNPYLMMTDKYQSYQIDRPEDFPVLEAMSKSLGAFI